VRTLKLARQLRLLQLRLKQQQQQLLLLRMA
jgi:hypothetical protein